MSLSGHPLAHPSHRMIDSITGLRAVAALWVLLLHLCLGAENGYLPGFEGKVAWGFAEQWIRKGRLGVDLFFMISGFVMLHVYAEHFREKRDGRTVLAFYLLRLGRIYPLHLAMLLLLAGLYGFGIWQAKPVSIGDILLNLTLLNAVGEFSVNTPAWSVSVEMFAYLCFPFLVPVFMRLTGKWSLMALCFGMALVYALTTESFQWWYQWDHGAVAYVRVMAGFVIGGLLYQLSCHHRPGKATDAELGLIFFVAGFLLLSLTFPFTLIYLFMPPMFFFIVVSPRLAQLLLANRLMVWLGTISYSIYMVHYPVLEFFRMGRNDYYAGLNPATDQPEIILQMGIIVLTVIAAAALTYYTIEQPCRDRVKRWLEGKRSV